MLFLPLMRWQSSERIMPPRSRHHSRSHRLQTHQRRGHTRPRAIDSRVRVVAKRLLAHRSQGCTRPWSCNVHANQRCHHHRFLPTGSTSQYWLLESGPCESAGLLIWPCAWWSVAGDCGRVAARVLPLWSWGGGSRSYKLVCDTVGPV
jgi:hypothetical protein